MALRMINGTFDQFDVHQFGNSAGSMEDETDKTYIECWYKIEEGKLSQAGKLIEDALNYPFKGDYQDVTTGSIVQTPQEIPLNSPLVFYVFQVKVGRAFVMKKSTLQ